jgi:hypothetical protein
MVGKLSLRQLSGHSLALEILRKVARRLKKLFMVSAPTCKPTQKSGGVAGRPAAIKLLVRS